MSAPRYFGQWKDHAGMVADWSDYAYVGEDYQDYQRFPPDGIATDAEVLFASYATPSYEGHAVVIFERDGKLWEAAGDHCSCNGLEKQWKPTEVTWAALAMRPVPDPGSYGWLHDHSTEAQEAWKALIASRSAPAGGSR